MNSNGIWSSPAERRRSIAVASGVLIAVALVADWLLGWRDLRTALMVAAALFAGADIAVRAWAALRVRHLGIEVLVTIAAAGALVIGEVWEAAAVTFLFALGGYLEARTLDGTRRAIQTLLEVAPATATVLREEVQVTVSAAEVEPGDLVLIKPGAKVPVDGTVVSGRTAMDESAITGESVPTEKQPGDRVFAGTVNQGGLLRVRATAIGADTTLGRIIARVEEAQEAKAPAQRFIERFARWYTPAVLTLAVVAYLVSRDVALALTLLVIGCPGALVISIPVSVVAGIGRAAREGILIKGGEHLERAGRITALALDKTGTLTEGRPRLTQVAALSRVLATGTGTDAEQALDVCDASAGEGASGCAPAHLDLLWTAAVAENGSEHPLARPILAQASTLGDVPSPDHLDIVAGRGIRALHRGSRIDVGSAAALHEWGIGVPATATRQSREIANHGGTPLMVAVDGALAGLLGVADAPRANAASALRRLRGVGVRRMVMLTGDSDAAANAIARAVGIDEVHAGLLPGEKLDRIRQLQRDGEVVAMVGDGINDAPALARADVGIAMGAAGTDVAIETADIALMADDLEKIPRAIEISRKTLANMKQNVAVAVLTVGGLLAGVLTGDVHMAGGMLIHELSVLAVIANGMRLMRA